MNWLKSKLILIVAVTLGGVLGHILSSLIYHQPINLWQFLVKISPYWLFFGLPFFLVTYSLLSRWIYGQKQIH